MCQKTTGSVKTVKIEKAKETSILTSVQMRPNLDFINFSNAKSCHYVSDKRFRKAEFLDFKLLLVADCKPLLANFRTDSLADFPD